MVTLTAKLNIKTLLDYIDLARYSLYLPDNNKRYEDRHEECTPRVFDPHLGVDDVRKQRSRTDK